MRLDVRQKKGGFTLVEMLVSIGLFSIVLTVTLGSIVTIADSNKKARSLMSVMGNLNFAVDSLTRSIKTGSGVDVVGGCVETEQINYDSETAFAREDVTFCFEEDPETGRGILQRQIENGEWLDMTSPDVDIDSLEFDLIGGVVGETQPRVLIRMEGTVRVSPRVSSNFTIQTTVSQRQLNI